MAIYLAQRLFEEEGSKNGGQVAAPWPDLIRGKGHLCPLVDIETHT